MKKKKGGNSKVKAGLGRAKGTSIGGAVMQGKMKYAKKASKGK